MPTPKRLTEDGDDFFSNAEEATSDPETLAGVLAMRGLAAYIEALRLTVEEEIREGAWKIANGGK